MRRAALVALVAAVLLVGCEDEDAAPSITDPSIPARSQTGIQATGTLDGARVAISRGNPTVVLGDCDANDGLDDDLCIAARTIDGLSVNLVIENPTVLVAGETVTAGASCSGDCDEVTAGAVVELRVDGQVRRVDRGSFDVLEAGPRWAASFDLTLLGGGRLIGQFDVEPG